MTEMMESQHGHIHAHFALACAFVQGQAIVCMCFQTDVDVECMHKAAWMQAAVFCQFRVQCH